MNYNAQVNSTNTPFPHVYIENVFTEQQLERIFVELDYYQLNKESYFEDGNGTASAKSSTGVTLKKNKGFFLTEVYTHSKYSYIGQCVAKLFSPKIFSQQSNHYFNGFRPALTGFLISYYGDGDYYKPHPDSAVGSMVIWLYKEPKKFTGGDFIFSDYPDLKFEAKNNCAILFPSRYMHQVNPVKISAEDQENGYGRYSFNLFLENFSERNTPGAPGMQPPQQ